MKQKWIALAVISSAFVPAAFAQTANPVTLYGRIWVMVNSVKASGSATPLSTRTTVVDESSLIGFRGTEDLGGGLKAFFQLESSAPPDAGGGTFGSRNSGVGLIGGFGTLVLGKWDSPFKLSAIFVDPYSQNTLGNQLSVINTGNFNRRENNMMQYWTPNWNGFSARFMYGANEARVAAANPSSQTVSLDYAAGGFRINYGYEKHKDQRGATVTAGVTESGQNLAGTYVFGPIKVGLLTQKIKSTDRTDKKAYMAAITYTSGLHQFIASVGRVRDGAVSTAAQPESKLSSIGYNYNFSKRTTFMARYASLKNNASANLALSGSDLPSIALNGDPQGFGMGLRHTF